jgi:hypothetical protein
MAANPERAVIKSVKNDVVKVALPYLEGAVTTFLTASVAATGTTLTVKNNSDFTQNDYLILEEIGGELAEIVRITAAVTAGTSLTVSACVFAHGIGTKITRIRYNKVMIYSSATDDSSASADAIAAAVAIDVQHGFNELKATTPNTYYFARYYHEQATTYSSYSDSALATGLTSNSRGEIKNEFLSIYNEQVDELITDDWLNRSLNRWQRELQNRRRHWSCLKYSTITDLVEDQQGYTAPTDMQTFDNDSILSVKIEDEGEMNPIDQKVFTGLTYNYVGTSVSTAAAVGATSLVLSDSSDFTQQNGTCYCKGVKIGYTLNTESTGTLSGITTCVAITAFADAGSGYTTVTAAGHGLHNGDTAYIGSTRNYDGSYTVSGVAGNNFNILKTYVADDATGAVAEYDDVITETLSVGDEVWETRTSGEPMYFYVDPQSKEIKLDPIPSSVYDNKNLYIEYWRKFPNLEDDTDLTLFPWVENAYLYLDWQRSIRRRLSLEEQTNRKVLWQTDLERLVAEDPDPRELRFTPMNFYKQIY